MKTRIIFVLLFGLGMIDGYGQMDSLLNRLSFEMDFRFRIEQDWSSRKSDGTFREDRTRLRYRFRTGLSYSDGVQKIAFRIRTGDQRKQQDPQLTLGKGLKEFGTLPIGFEKIYYQRQIKTFKFWLGKNTYPFVKNNELFWSDNVFPEGVFLEKSFQINDKPFSARVGHFILESNDLAFADDAYFQAVQLSGKFLEDRLEIFPTFLRFRNIVAIPDGFETFNLDYTYLNWGSKLKLLQNRKLHLELDYYYNFEDYSSHPVIDPNLQDQKSGYVIGIQYGRLKNKGDWIVKASYAYLERFANVDYMAQNDWARWDYSSFDSPDGRLSNLEGTEIVMAYLVNPKLKLVMKYYYVEQLVPYGISKENGHRIRFDMDVSF